ncbi:alpha/beta hydrolase [Gordonia amicalis]|nr:alpha/beta hydrolase [Gordonia amicalis]
MNAGGALGVARLAAAGALLTGLVRPAEARRRLRSQQYENALFNSREPERTSWALTDDGARLRVHHYGSAEAPVLVLIHGWSCCIEYWNPQINALAERYHVIAYDQRGHGESTWGKRKFDADVLADDLQTVVEQAVPDSSKAVFVGHSMGGITVQAWAHRHQDRVEERAAALVLANTTWGGIAAETRVLPLLNNPLKAPLWLGQAALAIPFPFPGGRVARSLVRTRILNGRAATIDHAAFVLAMTRSCSPAARAKAAVALVELALGPVGGRSDHGTHHGHRRPPRPAASPCDDPAHRAHALDPRISRPARRVRHRPCLQHRGRRGLHRGDPPGHVLGLDSSGGGGRRELSRPGVTPRFADTETS